jgi:tRNA 2-selenouridine synthase
VLLAQHYDPAYLKSIDRNFSRFGQASVLEIAGVSADAFDDAAMRLLTVGAE